MFCFLGIHSSYYYKSYFGEDTEDDYDYQFNVVYDYQAFADADALIIAYGSLCIFLDEKKVKLASLKPDTDTTKITLKVKEKKSSLVQASVICQT